MFGILIIIKYKNYYDGIKNWHFSYVGAVSFLAHNIYFVLFHYLPAVGVVLLVGIISSWDPSKTNTYF